jgi:hypothetical protein
MFRHIRQWFRQTLEDADASQAVAGRSNVVNDPCPGQREKVVTNFKVRNRQSVRQALHQPRTVQPTAVTGEAL